jgi:hypothetical protein
MPLGAGVTVDPVIGVTVGAFMASVGGDVADGSCVLWVGDNAGSAVVPQAGAIASKASPDRVTSALISCFDIIFLIPFTSAYGQ